MIKIENSEVMGWEHAIHGMRNPMNSWEKSDSDYRKFLSQKCDECGKYNIPDENSCDGCWVDNYKFPYKGFIVGPNDFDLMTRLRNAGTDHRKFMRMIVVYLDITAPLYWWKEFDTYKVGTVANSCSTMYKIAEKEFTLEDFSHEHLAECDGEWVDILTVDPYSFPAMESTDILKTVVEGLNRFRSRYLETKDKKYWWLKPAFLPKIFGGR